MAIWFQPKAVRKAHAIDALKRTQNDARVICMIACVFWEDGSYEKARTWFDRARTADPDNGDIWATWWKFEDRKGTKEQRDMVTEMCVAAEPRHGWKWPEVAKDVRNIGKSTGQILELVASTMRVFV